MFKKNDNVIEIIYKLCKLNISDTFKTCPIKLSQWPLFCLKWNAMYKNLT